MAPSHDPFSPDAGPLDDEVIDLEPTMLHVAPAGSLGAGSPGSDRAPVAAGVGARRGEPRRASPARPTT